MTESQVTEMPPIQKKGYGFLKWTSPRTMPNTDDERSVKDSSESEYEDDRAKDLADLVTFLQCRQWEEGGHVWQQYVSTEPATREEVIKLADKLDEALLENGARESGICDVRSAIYAELFNELIRQEGVAFGRRGKMLAEMRDEMSRALDEYRNLYLSSTEYGIRKVIQAEEILKKLENEKEELRLNLKKLNTDLSELTEKYDMAEKQYEEIHKLNEEKHNYTVEYFTENNKILKDNLVAFLAPKK